MTYYSDYPSKPIGGGNPYYCCSFCGISDPQINGDLEGHAEHCEYRISKLAAIENKALIEKVFAEDIARLETISKEDVAAFLEEVTSILAPSEE